MTIVFWNTNKTPRLSAISNLSTHLQPDILLLCEIEERQAASVLAALNHTENNYVFYQDDICEKIFMFHKLGQTSVIAVTGGRRYMAVQIKHAEYTDFSLVCLHYQSKLHWSTQDQAANTIEMALEIRRIEERTQNAKTIIIGDFNMNPFEDGMVQTTGFHNVMSKEIAKRGSRIVNDRSYPFFYNPMWSFFGDLGKGGKVSGTWFGSLSKPICYFWNIFDQVLVRPDLLDHFDEEKLEIITELGDISLLKANNTIDDSISDHLPISVKIKKLQDVNSVQ